MRRVWWASRNIPRVLHERMMRLILLTLTTSLEEDAELQRSNRNNTTVTRRTHTRSRSLPTPGNCAALFMFHQGQQARHSLNLFTLGSSMSYRACLLCATVLLIALACSAPRVGAFILGSGVVSITSGSCHNSHRALFSPAGAFIKCSSI